MAILLQADYNRDFVVMQQTFANGYHSRVHLDRLIQGALKAMWTIFIVIVIVNKLSYSNGSTYRTGSLSCSTHLTTL